MPHQSTYTIGTYVLVVVIVLMVLIFVVSMGKTADRKTLDTMGKSYDSLSRDVPISGGGSTADNAREDESGNSVVNAIKGIWETIKAFIEAIKTGFKLYKLTH